MKRASIWIIILAPLVGAAARGDDDAGAKAARSVHLHYSVPEAAVFYNEVTVDESQKGTYFCACGFGHGYMGIQESAKGEKVVIFSVWDPGKQDNAKDVPQDQRVEVVYHADDIEVSRFGGEGTGAHCFLSYPWNVSETCRFVIKADVVGEKTAYGAWFYRNDTKAWKHMATFSTRAKRERLKGLYSFVEDFRRDGASVKERRMAHYGNGWSQSVDGTWVALTHAMFTGDATPLSNIDSGVKGDAFYLATGGATTQSTKLNETIKRPPVGVTLPDFHE